ncbi:hypothetical protein T439DRAFT_347908, partial [Meredithblackwellia eburnea MCA 4105]
MPKKGDNKTSSTSGTGPVLGGSKSNVDVERSSRQEGPELEIKSVQGMGEALWNSSLQVKDHGKLGIASIQLKKCSHHHALFSATVSVQNKFEKDRSIVVRLELYQDKDEKKPENGLSTDTPEKSTSSGGHPTTRLEFEVKNSTSKPTKVSASVILPHVGQPAYLRLWIKVRNRKFGRLMEIWSTEKEAHPHTSFQVQQRGNQLR